MTAANGNLQITGLGVLSRVGAAWLTPPQSRRCVPGSRMEAQVWAWHADPAKQSTGPADTPHRRRGKSPRSVTQPQEEDLKRDRVLAGPHPGGPAGASRGWAARQR